MKNTELSSCYFKSKKKCWEFIFTNSCSWAFFCKTMPYDEKLACIASYSNTSPSLVIPIAVFLLVHWKISAQKCWYLSGMTGWMADWPLQLWFTTTHLCLTLMVLCRCLIRGDCHSNVYSFPCLLPKDFLLIFFSLCQICRLIVNFNCWSFLYQQLLFQCRLLRGFFFIYEDDTRLFLFQ